MLIPQPKGLVMIEIWQTINQAVHAALRDDRHHLSEHELIRDADELLLQMPTVSGSAPTAAQLLRRYRTALQHELCVGHQPRPLPPELEDQVRELTRAVMVVLGGHEGMSVEIAVLLALAIRANGVQHFCALSSAAIG
jgi:hypothetical protein